MFSRTYGYHRNRSRQNEWVTYRRNERFRRYRPPPSHVRYYRFRGWGLGGRPNRRRAHERDAAAWARSLQEEEKKKLEEANRLAREAEDKAQLEAARLDELRKEVLLVESVDLHIPENTEQHHTDRYDCTEDEEDPQLVVRRGQEFSLSLTFQRHYSPEHDDMEIIFHLGEEPNPRKGTYVEIKLREDEKKHYMEGKKKTWGARILKNEANTLTIGVYAPPDAIIGEWEYSIKTIKEAKKEEYECSAETEIVILLNPWCKDDQVFYSGDVKDLNEYILNQSGASFFGSVRSVRSKPWGYAQFQQGILEISLHLLRKANNYAVSPQMKDAVYISRALSRILNDCDDDGVLSGKWDGKYEDGVRPTKWIGSAAILKKYWETRSPVKYGQCWVFSAILTTVARALGLPCRSMTNFASAHDTDLTMTIDKYYDQDSDEVEYKNGDSVWNFHVWNEVWINRPELDSGGKYDGWHAVDSTPQETSEGVYQCGPAPLRAIKEGDVHVGYDTKFIFAECNAECCDWQDGYPPSLIKKNTYKVGKFMSTKKPDGGKYKRGEEGRLDVTRLYKYEEGSTAERAVVEKATGRGDLGDVLFTDVTGVHLEVLEDKSSDPLVGEDVNVVLQLKNTAKEEREYVLLANARPTSYWGGLRGKEKIIKKDYGVQTIKPGETKTHEMKILAKDYLRLCQETMTMRVLAIAYVKDFQESPVFTSEELDVALPAVDVQGPTGKVTPGQEFSVTVSFENPLKDRKLTGCELDIEGDIIPQGTDLTHKDSTYTMVIGELGPGERKEVILQVKPSVKPKKSKEREMELILSSNELPDFDGSFGVDLN